MFQVVLFQCVGSFNGVGVFSQYMMYVFCYDWVQFMRNSVEFFNGDIMQGWLLEEMCIGFVLFMMGVVFVVNQGMFEVIVDDDDSYIFGYGNCFGFQ